MVDTHSHIYESEFDADRAEALQRALDAGINRLLLPNINEESLPRMLDMCRKYPGICYPMFGLHPEDVHEDWQTVIEDMFQVAPLECIEDGYIAIGEVGLDFYWDDTFRSQQIEAFEYQICIAKKYGLPLVIHTRKAEPELIDAMDRHKSDNLTGIFHCFSGSVESANRLLKYPGFVLGIGGVLTFKNSKLARTLSENVPLNRIVMETDDPYLAPMPYRGKRNEPAYMTYVRDALAEIYNIDSAEVENITNKTVNRIFPLMQ